MAQESGVKNVKSVKPRTRTVKRSDPKPSPGPAPKPPAVPDRRGGGGSFGPAPLGRVRGNPVDRVRGNSVGRAVSSGPGGGGVDLFGGGAGGGGGGFDLGPGPDLGAINDTDYLAGDAQYQAQLAALMKALQDTETDFGAQRGRYETSFGESMRGLGWTPEVADDPNTPEIETAPGAWNMTDQNTASGRALTNQQNDFASRGMLQSSLFGRANDDLMRSLNDQLGGMQTGRTSFLDDLARQQSAYKTDNLSQQQQARAEALARRAAGLSL